MSRQKSYEVTLYLCLHTQMFLLVLQTVIFRDVHTFPEYCHTRLVNSVTIFHIYFYFNFYKIVKKIFGCPYFQDGPPPIGGPETFEQPGEMFSLEPSIGSRVKTIVAPGGHRIETGIESSVNVGDGSVKEVSRHEVSKLPAIAEGETKKESPAGMTSPNPIPEEEDDDFTFVRPELPNSNHSMIKRLRRLRGVCSRVPSKGSETNKAVYRNKLVFYSIEQAGIVVCQVPKAGSTYWREHVLTHHGGIIHYLRKLRTIHRSYANLTKIMVVRHPLVRLWSAYNDKFVNMDPAIINKHGARFVQLIRKPIQKVSDSCLTDVTFSEFIQYVVQTIDRDLYKGYDTHWAPYWKLCQPCDVPYDAILKLETFKEDMEYVNMLKSFNITHDSSKSDQAFIDDKCRMLKQTYLYYYALDRSCSASKAVVTRKLESLKNKGFIPNGTHMFNLKEIYGDDLYDTCLKHVTEMLKTNREGIHKRKVAAMLKDYDSLSKQLFHRLISIFYLDFQLFGYDPYSIWE